MNLQFERKNLDPLIERISQAVASHEMEEPGKYRRWIWQNEEKSRDLGVNAYGCADAANILYTIGRFPTDPAIRQSWVKNQQALQRPDTGEFPEGSHFILHTTAHCTAALELFDQRPLYRPKFVEQYLEKGKLYELLEGLEWVKSPWNNSHKGAGVFVTLVLCGLADLEWKRWYFDWLYEQADPETGLWRKGCMKAPGSAPLYCHMASTFHYLFNHEAEKRPLRYPEKLVDTCLTLFRDDICGDLGRNVGFVEIDWVFCLNRAFRQCGHRPREVKEAIIAFFNRFYDYLMSLDCERDDSFNDLHLLFGMTCALAETAQAVPGIIESSRPLRLVLDRRPFI